MDRLNSISVARLLAMISIIICHFFQYYNNEWAYWFNVGVQIFFMISGFLYGNKEIVDPISWIKKQFIKICVPYYVFLLFSIILYAAFVPQCLTISSVVRSIFTIGPIHGLGHLWFVSNILVCYLITPYLSCIADYLNRFTCSKSMKIFLFLFVVYNIISILIHSHFRPGHISCYIIGYFSAVYINKRKDFKLNQVFFATLLPTFLTVGGYCYLKYYKEFPFVGYASHLTDFSHLFLGYSLTLLMMIVFRNVNRFSLLDFSDKYSYDIYIVHQLLILSPFTLLTVTDSISLNILITAVTIIISGWILYIVCKPIHRVIIG